MMQVHYFEAQSHRIETKITTLVTKRSFTFIHTNRPKEEESAYQGGDDVSVVPRLVVHREDFDPVLWQAPSQQVSANRSHLENGKIKSQAPRKRGKRVLQSLALSARVS